ncbi:hypothetical protein M0G43_11385 [Subsaxibacter sp. CAU 1640]|uniref:hypothetical protein n=1 Tax=Subsaxibacter sp. CAU 1640 TaxID=2933271 RepID=UPI002002EB6A|nr:hypothetical protein [Subsaxibacter sp. CAU 1640]MCK7591179.1 hypothetical protein [Subsaxibacter sp. CAU 1640]
MNNKQLIGFLGLGAFSALSILSFAYLLQVMIRDANFLMNIEPKLNFWITESLTFLIFIIVSLLFLTWSSQNLETLKKSIKKALVISIATYFLINVFQFIYTFYGTQYIMEKSMENMSDYYDYLKENPLYRTCNSIVVYIEYIIFGLIVFFKMKEENSLN